MACRLQEQIRASDIIRLRLTSFQNPEHYFPVSIAKATIQMEIKIINLLEAPQNHLINSPHSCHLQWFRDPRLCKGGGAQWKNVRLTQRLSDSCRPVRVRFRAGVPHVCLLSRYRSWASYKQRGSSNARGQARIKRGKIKTNELNAFLLSCSK